ncbi:MAG: HyaD/HybD family hydrogenase maturation endopeptidase [Campylobacterales bacterium]|nr:HyaD/HybD family hydrogenase maturation endopeptidase [Campylobacterales bacterium]
MHKLTILGIGNILQFDDGIGIYATAFLKKNYDFTPSIHVKEGGVAGMALLDTLEQTHSLIILDSIQIDDAVGSIYVIPAYELRGYGINSGGAHEVGVLEALDMLELQGKKLPNATVIGIIPQEIDLQIGLSNPLQEHFNAFIKTVLENIEKLGFKIERKSTQVSLREIINSFQD